jgi:hypothetical protein
MPLNIFMNPVVNKPVDNFMNNFGLSTGHGVFEKLLSVHASASRVQPAGLSRCQVLDAAEENPLVPSF